MSVFETATSKYDLAEHIARTARNSSGRLSDLRQTLADVWILRWLPTPSDLYLGSVPAFKVSARTMRLRSDDVVYCSLSCNLVFAAAK